MKNKPREGRKRAGERTKLRSRPKRGSLGKPRQKPQEQGNQNRATDEEEEKSVAEEATELAVDAFGTGAEELSEASNKFSRQMQKRRTQKEIMKREGEVKAASSAGLYKGIGERLEALTSKTGEAISTFISENPLPVILGGLALVVVLIVTSSFSACGLMLTGGDDAVLTSCFTASDGAIKAVEKDYKKLEQELQKKMDQLEKSHKGYDEYRKSIATISHDPFELAALLTVVYESYTERGVKAYLQTILDAQYEFTTTESTETRTRMVTKWHFVTRTREVTKVGFKWQGFMLVPYTYTVTEEYQSYESYQEEEQYQCKILTAKLTGKSIDDYVRSMGLSEQQLFRYDLLLQTKGNKPEIFGK